MNRDGNDIINTDTVRCIFANEAREDYPARIWADVGNDSYLLAEYSTTDDALDELDALYEALVSGVVGVNLRTNEKTVYADDDDD
ncbi:MAG: hypothetical protein LUF28_05525 [Clostridiales bacterium]|nr:hypothetical protein [Clostridiales bacterium]